MRQVENLASNKENFNYLTGKQKQVSDVVDSEEVGDDTEIDITKYLVSPKQVQVSRTQVEDKLTGEDKVVTENNIPDKLNDSDDVPIDSDRDQTEVNVIEILI